MNSSFADLKCLEFSSAVHLAESHSGRVTYEECIAIVVIVFYYDGDDDDGGEDDDDGGDVTESHSGRVTYVD